MYRRMPPNRHMPQEVKRCYHSRNLCLSRAYFFPSALACRIPAERFPDSATGSGGVCLRRQPVFAGRDGRDGRHDRSLPRHGKRTRRAGRT
ncbi:hypothetical protein CBM2634_B60239 [Cupriavidus taiwanensis]|uniref:Uncharacterized protein n=1 Tax=Cupriavidus taiwanensis TaxID=164546 RepID=A0A375JCW7_9BURK|nr:hypothetical protein CBM2634_B60239 [Cupriavidus taiwanensis]